MPSAYMKLSPLFGLHMISILPLVFLLVLFAFACNFSAFLYINDIIRPFP